MRRAQAVMVAAVTAAAARVAAGLAVAGLAPVARAAVVGPAPAARAVGLAMRAARVLRGGDPTAVLVLRDARTNGRSWRSGALIARAYRARRWAGSAKACASERKSGFSVQPD